jgi:hypothetical protein
VLDEAQVEVEGALVVPDGFKVSDPPSEEALIEERGRQGARGASHPPQVGGVRLVLRPVSSPRPTTTSAARSAATRSTSLLTTRSTARTRTTSRTCSSSTSTGRRTTPSTTRGSCWSRSSHPEEKRSAVRWRPVRHGQKEEPAAERIASRATDTSAHRRPGQRGPRCAHVPYSQSE